MVRQQMCGSEVLIPGRLNLIQALQTVCHCFNA